jgi:hypothetical protein
MEYAKPFVVNLPQQLALARCEEDGAMAVPYKVRS